MTSFFRRASQFGPLALLIASFQRWSDKRASSKGAALALYMIFSLAPILVLVVATSGWLFGEDAVRNEILMQIRQFAGDRSAEVVATVMQSAHQSNNGALAALVSVGLLIFSSTTAFAELKSSLDEMWDVDLTKHAGFRATAASRLVAFGVVLSLSACLLATVLINAVLAALKNYWIVIFGEQTYASVTLVLTNAFSFAIFVTLFAVVLKMLPSVPMRWRDVFPGALLTTLLFAIGKTAIGFYLGQGTVISAYGAAGSVVALIMWIYFSALIFFFGAAFTREYWARYGSGRKIAPVKEPGQAVPYRPA